MIKLVSPDESASQRVDTVNLYREKPGVKVVRRGRYRRVKVGPLALEWYPS